VNRIGVADVLSAADRSKENHVKHAMRTAAAVMAITLGVAACGSDKKSSSTAAPTTAAATVTTAATATTAASATTAPATGASTGGAAADAISIKSFKFIVPASVASGTSLTITNADTQKHTFTDKAGSFSVDVPGGGSATLTIAKPGTYDLICKIHAQMSGQLVVT
jgi:plastocyanin